MGRGPEGSHPSSHAVLIELAMAGLLSLGAATHPGAVLTAQHSSLLGPYDLGGLEILVVSDLSELEPTLQRLRAAAEAAWIDDG